MHRVWILEGVISIHALREEGDIVSVVLISSDIVFLSTPSARRATTGIKNVASGL